VFCHIIFPFIPYSFPGPTVHMVSASDAKKSPPQEQYHKSEMPTFHKMYDSGILLCQITFIKVVGRLSFEACYEVEF
jgi:hypothetical protein